MTALTGLVQNQPWYILLAATAAMLFALMLAISLCRALVVLAQHGFAAICQGVSTLTEWMFATIVATVLACGRVTGKLLLALLWYVSRPFVLAADQARSFIRTRVDALMAGVERQREMRKLWRESGFGTWKEFRWAFENGAVPTSRDTKVKNRFRDADRRRPSKRRALSSDFRSTDRSRRRR